MRCARCKRLKQEDRYDFCPVCLRQMTQGSFLVEEITSSAREISAREADAELVAVPVAEQEEERADDDQP
jgi:RNA polymerase subunit RPABC4/transcription elongation factor Spt4